MSGITLMFSGIVLISNGFNHLDHIDDNSNSLINIFTGSLYILLNILFIAYGLFNDQPSTYYYGAISGLLFGYTYLSYGVNRIFKWDNRNLGFFSLFVTINSIVFAYMIMGHGIGGTVLDATNWIVWGLLWLTNFLIYNLGMKFGDWLYYATIIAGVVTCWIPGMLMLLGLWP